eukprot:TRINITY_DN12_c0_g5_i1.p1 TRINITY_DN12_c0_g5~~TRINITY_DN12_c0_g5_i1.p1  ORF type:complete len:366 (-),score=65.33 TRINITY_DN12_c0_g5_i1:23-1120(-)
MAVSVFAEHTDSVYCVCTNPTLDLGASGGGDDCAMIFDLHTNQVIHKLTGHTDSVTAIGFSSDGKLLATGSLDTTVKIWDTANGTLLHTLEGSCEYEWLQWHERGPVLVAGGGGGDGCAWMWHAQQGRCMTVFAGHTGAVTCGCFTPSGVQLCTGSEDGTVRVWDPKSGAPTTCISTSSPAAATQRGGKSKGRGKAPEEIPLTSVRCSNDGNLLAAAHLDGTVAICNLSTYKVLTTVHARDSVEAVDFLPMGDGQLLLTASLDGTLGVWDSSSGLQRCACVHGDRVGVTALRVARSPISIRGRPARTLAWTAAADGCVRAWDPRDGSLVQAFTGHSAPALDIAVCRDNLGVLSCSDDNTVRLFRL